MLHSLVATDQKKYFDIAYDSFSRGYIGEEVVELLRDEYDLPEEDAVLITSDAEEAYSEYVRDNEVEKQIKSDTEDSSAVSREHEPFGDENPSEVFQDYPTSKPVEV